MSFYHFLLVFLLPTTFVVHGQIHNVTKDEAIKKTIESPDGDVIDCYDIYQQPALKHPLLKDHQIKLKPKQTTLEWKGPSTSQVKQTWHINGTCPEGTVPIRRTFQNDINTIPYNFSIPFTQYLYGQIDSASPQVEAVVDYSAHGPYHGIYAELDVWDIHVEPNEYSNTFVVVVGVDPNDTKTINQMPFKNLDIQIQFGWAVLPAYYKDSHPRLHLYMTVDGGKSKICMNNDCGSFVQTSKNIALGTRLTPTSKVGGTVYKFDASIKRELDDEKWWVVYNHEEIGYYPKEALSGFYYGSLVARGAIVLNTMPGGKHTSTQMGSGHYPLEGVGTAAEIDEVQCITNTGQLATDPRTGQIITKPNCYGYKDLTINNNGSYFLYGGPGGPNCDY